MSENNNHSTGTGGYVPKGITAYIGESQQMSGSSRSSSENPAVDYENELLSDHYPGLQPPRAGAVYGDHGIVMTV